MLLPSALGFSPHPPVSVYGTGRYYTIAAFLDRSSGHFSTLFRSTSQLRIPIRDFSLSSHVACPRSTLLGCPCSLCPHSSDNIWCRNINLLSIDYAFRPRLRSRLPQGRSALPWNPWIFGQKDSHLLLATHSGILSSLRSAAPYRYSFYALMNAPLPIKYTRRCIQSLGFGVVFQPR